AARDVGSEPGSMNERPQQSRPGKSFEMGARFGQASSHALDRADCESTADEGVQRDPARHDVPARLLPREIDRVEHLGFDECELVAMPWPAEGAATVVVAVTDESTPCGRIGTLDPRDGAFS